MQLLGLPTRAAGAEAKRELTRVILSDPGKDLTAASFCQPPYSRAADAIAHDDRRELRGARVLAAWIDHFDSREQNSMDSWMADNAEVPDSSPGYVRHFYIDTSDSLGSEWDWAAIRAG